MRLKFNGRDLSQFGERLYVIVMTCQKSIDVGTGEIWTQSNVHCSTASSSRVLKNLNFFNVNVLFFELFKRRERLSWCAMMTMDNRIEEFTHTIYIQDTWLQPRRPTLRHETSWERNEETLSSENVVNVDKQMKYERVKWNMKELKGKENTQNSKTQD